jgi:O-antigen ligase
MQWILIGYMFLFIHRPFEIWPFLGDFHFERLYMLGALAALVVHPDKRWLPNRQHLAYFAFVTAVLFCWLCSPWADKGQQAVEDYLKLIVFYVMIVLVVHDEKSLKLVALAFLGVMFVYMMHSLKEYVGGRHVFRMGIDRMIGVDTTLGDPNSFGATIVYALPFVVPFWVCRPTLMMRGFLVSYVGLSAICIGLTGSRSSLLGMVICGMVMVARSRRRYLWGALGLVAAPVAFLALPESLQLRFETIINPEVGPVSAQVSGDGRIEGILKGIELWQANPLSGVGPGVWRQATKSKIESHNLFGQLIGETGTLGAVTFLAILLCLFLNLRAIRKMYLAHPEWTSPDFPRELGRAVALAVFLMLFEGNFGHNLFRYNWLWYGGFLVIALHCLRQRVAAAEPASVDEPRWEPAAYRRSGFPA